MPFKFAFAIPVVFLAACATLEGPDPSNTAAYCTSRNGYLLGSQSKAYYGGCPKDTEAAFLSGLQRGRAIRVTTPAAWPFQEREDQLEKQLLATTSEPERERVRAQLRDAEWWALHVINCPCTYSNGP
jgi:hypothetical protein